MRNPDYWQEMSPNFEISNCHTTYLCSKLKRDRMLVPQKRILPFIHFTVTHLSTTNNGHMKLSLYNSYIPIADRHTLLYNALTGKFVTVKDQLVDIRDCNLQKLSDEMPVFYSQLCEGGMIVDDSYDLTTLLIICHGFHAGSKSLSMVTETGMTKYGRLKTSQVVTTKSQGMLISWQRLE